MTAQSPAHERLIITAASEEFGPSLLALLGSLSLDWPGHPPLLVYDLGLDEPTRRRVERHVPVRRVPAFCPHWRQHYTWKLWCLVDAPARDVLWLDAGLVVLAPLDEAFDALAARGVFLVANRRELAREASPAACRGCGVPPDFGRGKPTLAATLMGFRKEGAVHALLEEALAVAQVEEHIAASSVTHRHDQAILSLLVHKQLGAVPIADHAIYLGELTPDHHPGQKVWVHRRKLRDEDAEHYAAHIGASGPPHRPRGRHPAERRRADANLGEAHLWFAHGDLTSARAALEQAFRDRDLSRPTLARLAWRLHEGQLALRRFGQERVDGRSWLPFVLARARNVRGRRFALALAAALRLEEALEHRAAGRAGAARGALLRALAARPSLVWRDPRARDLLRAALRRDAGRGTTRPSAAGPR